MGPGTSVWPEQPGWGQEGQRMKPEVRGLSIQQSWPPGAKGSAGEDPVGSSYSKDSKRKTSSTPRGMIRFSAPQLKREAKRH